MAGSVELRENLWRLSEELLKEKLGRERLWDDEEVEGEREAEAEVEREA